jgi:hypothetical protein
MKKLIIWYAALSSLMVLAKYLERPASGGDGYAWIANILGLFLLQPWVSIAISERSSEINSFSWFLGLAILNVVLLIIASRVPAIMRSLRKRP